jgi:hypothetical protein
MEQRQYVCSMCGAVVTFYVGFKMVCKGWDRHVFSDIGEDDSNGQD